MFSAFLSSLLHLHHPIIYPAASHKFDKCSTRSSTIAAALANYRRASRFFVIAFIVCAIGLRRNRNLPNTPHITTRLMTETHRLAIYRFNGLAWFWNYSLSSHSCFGPTIVCLSTHTHTIIWLLLPTKNPVWNTSSSTTKRITTTSSSNSSRYYRHLLSTQSKQKMKHSKYILISE